MSDYQYYEFLAVDRPLSASDMADLRGVSSRALITPTSFSNHYEYGGLKADSGTLLQQYFDVHVYVANWGTRRLALRLPAEAAAPEELEAYCAGEGAGVRSTGAHTILDLCSESDSPDGWDDGRGWMGSLAGVRELLLRGDQRPLYLAWLHCLSSGELEEEEEEPPVPPGLAMLPAALTTLVEFLRIDDHVVAAAAEASAPAETGSRGLAEWIGALPPAEKDALLLRVAEGEHAQVAATLARRFEARSRPADTAPRRTVAELLERADELREAALERQAREAEEARRKQQAAAEAARKKRLDALAARGSEAWREVGTLVEAKKASAYDQAVKLLTDLRDLATREGARADFDRRLGVLRATHARRPAFVTRLDRAGLR